MRSSPCRPADTSTGGQRSGWRRSRSLSSVPLPYVCGGYACENKKVRQSPFWLKINDGPKRLGNVDTHGNATLLRGSRSSFNFQVLQLVGSIYKSFASSTSKPPWPREARRFLRFKTYGTTYSSQLQPSKANTSCTRTGQRTSTCFRRTAASRQVQNETTYRSWQRSMALA